ncbi:hypothetical protein CLAIMM_04059 isoform 1 [Cladophialophora immunda]|nr:hypothetical protein CLAIMM_04059 isoform 1 [Cladophialophora immunda]
MTNDVGESPCFAYAFHLDTMQAGVLCMDALHNDFDCPTQDVLGLLSWMGDHSPVLSRLQPGVPGLPRTSFYQSKLYGSSFNRHKIQNVTMQHLVIFMDLSSGADLSTIVIITTTWAQKLDGEGFRTTKSFDKGSQRRQRKTQRLTEVHQPTPGKEEPATPGGLFYSPNSQGYNTWKKEHHLPGNQG